MRVAFLDIEAWDLSPQFAPVLCVSVLSMPDGKMKTYRQDTYVRSKKRDAEDMTQDGELVRDARDFLEDHHLLVGWNSKGFDIPLLNTRLDLAGERLIQRHLHLDPMWFYRGWRGLKPMSSKLKYVAAYYELPESKLEVTPDTWLQARSGHKSAMDIVVERCESDVRLLKEVTDRCLDQGLVKNITSYP